MSNNKVCGTKFENILCNKLHDGGFWVRLMYPAPNGSQPFDVIAINRKGELFCIECKDCKNDVFDLRRIELNQIVSFDLLYSNYNCRNLYFAFNTSDGCIIVEAKKIIDYEREGKKSLKIDGLLKMGTKVEEFVKEKSGDEMYGK